MKTAIIPSLASILVGLIAGAWLWHHNPIVGTIGGPVLVVSGLIGGWILKPKAERIVTADEAKKVIT